MTNLREYLAQINPQIGTGAVAGFRSSLVAISAEVNGQPEAMELSLQQWWQWLDDEGYDRDDFARVATAVISANIGNQGLAEITAHIQAQQHQPAGIPCLLSHIDSTAPALAQEIDQLEDLAATEEKLLHSTAGGMSKAGVHALEAVGAVAGTALTAGAGVLTYRKIIKPIHQWWKERAAAKAEAAATRVREAEARAKDLVEQSREREAEKLREDGRRAREDIDNNFVKDLYENTDKDIHDLIAHANSQAARELAKKEVIEIHNFTPEMLKAKSLVFAKAHEQAFKREIEEQVLRVLKTKPEFEQAKPEFDQKLEIYKQTSVEAEKKLASEDKHLLNSLPADLANEGRNWEAEFLNSDAFKSSSLNGLSQKIKDEIMVQTQAAYLKNLETEAKFINTLKQGSDEEDAVVEIIDGEETEVMIQGKLQEVDAGLYERLYGYADRGFQDAEKRFFTTVRLDIESSAYALEDELNDYEERLLHGLPQDIKGIEMHAMRAREKLLRSIKEEEFIIEDF